MADGIFTDDELKADASNEVLTPEVEETAEQKAERERDEQGRFKAKEPAEEAPVGESDEEGRKKGDTVPQGALHAERERRKTSDAERDAAKAELATLREALGAIQKMREEALSRKPAEPAPVAEGDPAGIDHLTKRLSEVEQSTTRIEQQRDIEALNAHEMQQLGSFMGQSEAAFRQEKPDYDDAINHVVQARARELSRYGLDTAQIQQTIREEATDIVRTAVARGLNPAQLGYEIAQDRGYVPKQAEQKQEQARSNGANAILDAIEQAKKANKSLGSGGGSAPAQLNAESVLALSPEEFDRLYSTPEGKAMIDNL